MSAQGTLSALRTAVGTRVKAMASRVELFPVAFSPRMTHEGASVQWCSAVLADGSLSRRFRRSIALKLRI